MYYIQESDKPNWLFNKLNIIKVIGDKLIIPISKDENLKEKQSVKLAKKTKKILKEFNCKSVCASKAIKKQENYIKSLNNDIEIINGKWLYSVLANKVLDYIVKKYNIKKEETIISILINKLETDYMLEYIKQISSEYKVINIVTNNVKEFKKIEEIIFKTEDVMINITNNKKKGLMRSQIILNVDFKTELLNQYNIPEKAILINLPGNIQIKKKRFNGININDYEIKYKKFEEFDYDKYYLYDQKDIYESQIYKKQPFEYIKRKLEKDKVEILFLKGNKNQY